MEFGTFSVTFYGTVSGRRFSQILEYFWILWGSILRVWGHLFGHLFSDCFLMDFGVPALPLPPRTA